MTRLSEANELRAEIAEIRRVLNEEAQKHLPDGLAVEEVVRLIRPVIDRLCERRAAEIWQPIETAPKDGTYVLGSDHSDLSSGSRHVMRWTAPDELDPETWIVEDEYVWHPTWWMPLPAPPMPGAAR